MQSCSDKENSRVWWLGRSVIEEAQWENLIGEME